MSIGNETELNNEEEVNTDVMISVAETEQVTSQTTTTNEAMNHIAITSNATNQLEPEQDVETYPEPFELKTQQLNDPDLNWIHTIISRHGQIKPDDVQIEGEIRKELWVTTSI